MLSNSSRARLSSPWGKFAVAVFVLLLACFAGLGHSAPLAAAGQEYEGVIPFPNSDNVTLRFYLNDDGSQVEKIYFKLKKLRVYPVNTKSSISHSDLNDVGVTFTNPVTINNGKIVINLFLIADLTILDSCIYGNIGLKNSFGGKEDLEAKPVYAVFPNVTTPKTIPEDVKNPPKKP
ncbi:MAG: hypothetical protein LBI10_03580 [Deltaproteobacteria bacterium]|nr:hypothetical protein [Deltaproteobacteria bacterium]